MIIFIVLIIAEHRNNQSVIYYFIHNFDICSYKQIEVFKSVCEMHQARSHVLHTKICVIKYEESNRPKDL